MEQKQRNKKPDVHVKMAVNLWMLDERAPTQAFASGPFPKQPVGTSVWSCLAQMQRGRGVTLTLNANEMCRYRVIKPNSAAGWYHSSSLIHLTMGREENTPTWVQRSINDHFLPTAAYLWQREVQTAVNCCGDKLLLSKLRRSPENFTLQE